MLPLEKSLFPSGFISIISHVHIITFSHWSCRVFSDWIRVWMEDNSQCLPHSFNYKSLFRPTILTDFFLLSRYTISVSDHTKIIRVPCIHSNVKEGSWTIFLFSSSISFVACSLTIPSKCHLPSLHSIIPSSFPLSILPFNLPSSKPIYHTEQYNFYIFQSLIVSFFTQLFSVFSRYFPWPNQFHSLTSLISEGNRLHSWNSFNYPFFTPFLIFFEGLFSVFLTQNFVRFSRLRQLKIFLWSRSRFLRIKDQCTFPNEFLARKRTPSMSKCTLLSLEYLIMVLFLLRINH